MSIVAKNISWKAGKKIIVNDVSLVIPSGKTIGLIGPNGSGKSSLLRLLAGLRQPYKGQVLLNGQSLRQMSRKTVAKRIAFVEQHCLSNANMRVLDIVKLGRIPHHSAFSSWTSDDEKMVNNALTHVAIASKSEQRWLNLSGGEQQRVHIARALAQNPSEMFLDEPTNHLDIHHQIQLMKLISDLPITSIVAIHDLNHAARFCDELIVMKGGRIIAKGTPNEILTEQLLRDVFHVQAKIDKSPYHHTKHIHFLV